MRQAQICEYLGIEYNLIDVRMMLVNLNRAESFSSPIGSLLTLLH